MGSEASGILQRLVQCWLAKLEYCKRVAGFFFFFFFNVPIFSPLFEYARHIALHAFFFLMAFL